MRQKAPLPGPSFKGWVRPGPLPPGGLEPEPGETLSFLSGHFRIFQYERGHRFSADDLLTAWYASVCAPRIDSGLDLGSGIGSVAMLLSWKHPSSRWVTVEAQAESLALARKSLAYNGLEERITPLHGDLRNTSSVLLGPRSFDLVTGSPPYFPEGTATPAAHRQAVAARLETRGSVPDYVRAAAPRLAPGGFFIFVYRAGQETFVSKALEDEGLRLVRRRDVIFRDEEPPRITLHAAVLSSDLLPEALARQATPIEEPPLSLRDRAGAVTPEYMAIRLSMGFPPGEASIPSPRDRSGTIEPC